MDEFEVDEETARTDVEGFVGALYEFFLVFFKVGGRYRIRMIEEVLELLDMKEYEGAFIGELPAETLPFLYLGKAILQEPEWLLMDEPIDNMSVTARRKMIGI